MEKEKEKFVVLCVHFAVTNSSSPRISLVLKACNDDGGVKAPQERLGVEFVCVCMPKGIECVLLRG